MSEKIIRFILLFSAVLHVRLPCQTLQLNGEPSFGKDTDWANLPMKEVIPPLVVGPDGSMFLADLDRHQIVRFDANGKEGSRFGQLGQGPGDLHYPQLGGILDNRMLIVVNYPIDRKISLFDLQGRFIRQVRTEQPCYKAISLRNHIIAYSFKKFHQSAQHEPYIEFTEYVFLKNIETGLEKEVYRAEFTDKSAIRLPNNPGVSTSAGHFNPGLIMAATAKGELWIGKSDCPRLSLYNESGERIGTLDIDLKAEPVTRKHIESLQDKTINDLKETMRINHVKNSPIQKLFNSFDFSTLFDSHFPIYANILPLPGNRLLVTPFPTSFQNNRPLVCIMYSATGFRIKKLTIEPGEYSFYGQGPSLGRFAVTAKHLYALVNETTEDEDEFMRIIRMPINCLD